MSNLVMTVVRSTCKTCAHSYDPRELLGGLCSYCLLARAEKVEEFGRIFESPEYRCSECNAFILASAYRHWDVLANAFALLCVPCSDKAISKAGQYRNTPFAYMNKSQ